MYDFFGTGVLWGSTNYCRDQRQDRGEFIWFLNKLHPVPDEKRESSGMCCTSLVLPRAGKGNEKCLLVFVALPHLWGVWSCCQQTQGRQVTSVSPLWGCQQTPSRAWGIWCGQEFVAAHLPSFAQEHGGFSKLQHLEKDHWRGQRFFWLGHAKSQPLETQIILS